MGSKSHQGWRKPDAQFFLDDDGTLWIAYGCAPDGNLYLQEVDIDTFMPKGESHVFFMPDAKNRGWEGAKHKARGMEHGDGHGWIEGAQLLKHNGIYYLVYSLPDLGNTYANGVYTANHILGPYTYQQHNPITQKLTGFSPGSGHGEIVKDRYGATGGPLHARVYGHSTALKGVLVCSPHPLMMQVSYSAIPGLPITPQSCLRKKGNDRIFAKQYEPTFDQPTSEGLLYCGQTSCTSCGG